MGSPKGLLPAPAQSEAQERPALNLVERLLGISEYKLGFSTVLVGSRPEYEYLKRTTLLDKVPGCGPLGGLVALLEHAEQLQKSYAVAIACDLPYLGGELLRKLAFFEGGASVACAQSGSRYEPLFARYHVSCLPVLSEALDQRRLSLQPILSTLQAEVLSVTAVERQELSDWDSPSDMLGST